MGRLSGALYVLAGIVAVPYGVYIDKRSSPDADVWSFLFPDGIAIGLSITIAGLLVTATVLALVAAVKRPRRTEEPTDPTAKGPAARNSSASRAAGLRHTQFYDEYGGMQIRRNVDRRRPVVWASGAPAGTFIPNEYGGYTVTDVHGRKIADVADLIGGVEMLKEHLAKR